MANRRRTWWGDMNVPTRIGLLVIGIVVAGVVLGSVQYFGELLLTRVPRISNSREGIRMSEGARFVLTADYLGANPSYTRFIDNHQAYMAVLRSGGGDSSYPKDDFVATLRLTATNFLKRTDRNDVQFMVRCPGKDYERRNPNFVTNRNGKELAIFQLVCEGSAIPRNRQVAIPWRIDSANPRAASARDRLIRAEGEMKLFYTGSSSDGTGEVVDTPPSRPTETTPEQVETPNSAETGAQYLNRIGERVYVAYYDFDRKSIVRAVSQGGQWREEVASLDFEGLVVPAVTVGSDGVVNAVYWNEDTRVGGGCELHHAILRFGDGENELYTVDQGRNHDFSCARVYGLAIEQSPDEELLAVVYGFHRQDRPFCGGGRFFNCETGTTSPAVRAATFRGGRWNVREVRSQSPGLQAPRDFDVAVHNGGSAVSYIQNNVTYMHRDGGAQIPLMSGVRNPRIAMNESGGVHFTYYNQQGHLMFRLSGTTVAQDRFLAFGGPGGSPDIGSNLEMVADGASPLMAYGTYDNKMILQVGGAQNVIDANAIGRGPIAIDRDSLGNVHMVYMRNAGGTGRLTYGGGAVNDWHRDVPGGRVARVASLRIAVAKGVEVETEPDEYFVNVSNAVPTQGDDVTVDIRTDGSDSAPLDGLRYFLDGVEIGRDSDLWKVVPQSFLK